MYRKMKIFKLLMAGVLFSTLPAMSGDILTLQNKHCFDGKVLKVEPCAIVFKSEGRRYLIPAEDIFSIEFENPRDKVYTAFTEMAESDINKCMAGRMDAENYHGKKGWHFALGVLFGPFAMIGTALANPTPQKGRETYMLSKNKEFFSDPEYLSCYRSKAKGQLITWEALGWGAWILLILL